MATPLATPGVYIEEKSSFGTSVVPVQTAIPAFIGYTQKAVRGSKDLTNVPTKISSFGQFEELFGGAPDTKFNIESDESEVGFKLSFVEDTKYMLHSSMRLFFANGGADCYIVSVVPYGEKIDAAKLNDPKGGGLSALEKQMEPTIIVIPDAILLDENDCYSLQAQMLQHCGYKLKNRFFRAITFCILSSIFIVKILPHQNLMGLLGVIFFTVSFFIILKDEKMIDLAHSKKYRFSLIRQIFFLENLVYSFLPQKIKKFSGEILPLLMIGVFSIISREVAHILISIFVTLFKKNLLFLNYYINLIKNLIRKVFIWLKLIQEIFLV